MVHNEGNFNSQPIIWVWITGKYHDDDCITSLSVAHFEIYIKARVFSIKEDIVLNVIF